MANVGPTVWYIRDNAPTSTIGWSAVTAWATGAVKAAGALVRQLAAPTVGNERAFVCIVAGTTHATTEPTWVVTKGAKTTDNTVTWQECTGQPGVNGDLTNCPNWTTEKNVTITIGLVIQRNNAVSLQICTTAGTTGNGAEPSFSDTAGTTTADNTVTWTSLGAVGNFAAWAAPHARLANAYAANWGTAKNTFYVGDDHSETQSTNMTLTTPSSNTIANLCWIYCIDHTVSLPPTSSNLKTTATIATTGNTAITHATYCYYNGFLFKSGSGANNSAPTIGIGDYGGLYFENCTHAIVATGSGAVLALGNAGGSQKISLTNTILSFGATGQSVAIRMNNIVWRNTASAIGGTVPTTLFPGTGGAGVLLAEGIDLSAAGAGKTIVGAGLNSPSRFMFVDCKLGASVTLAATQVIPGAVADFIRCDSGATIYKQNRWAYEGILKPETTIIRSGGASDGTTGISWNLTTPAATFWVNPFECFPISIWNTVTGSTVTLTIEIVNDGTTLNNDDIWVDVEYMGSSATPIGSVATSTKSNGLAAGSAITSSSTTWTTTGLASPIKQKLVATFTPQLAGYLRAYVKMAKASKTVYVDPLITLS